MASYAIIALTTTVLSYMQLVYTFCEFVCLKKVSVNDVIGECLASNVLITHVTHTTIKPTYVNVRTDPHSYYIYTHKHIHPLTPTQAHTRMQTHPQVYACSL